MAEGKNPAVSGYPATARQPAYSEADETSAPWIANWRASSSGVRSARDLTLRSTFIVGFPGETEEDFQMLLDFLKEARLDRVGCFKYSPVEGATANELADQSRKR